MLKRYMCKYHNVYTSVRNEYRDDPLKQSLFSESYRPV